ncbi:MAG: metallophosphoesterase family protein [Desulfotomaculales bacterium]
MRLFYATDLHSSEVTFRKFLNAGKFYEADAVICGGDLIGKMVVPIVKNKKGVYNCTYYGSKVTIKKERDLADLEKNLRNAGFYFVYVNEDELGRFTEVEVDRIFQEKAMEAMTGWLKLAEERLKDTKIPYYIMPGNDDPLYIDELLNFSKRMQNIDGHVVKIGEFEIISISYSHPTRWQYPRDISEEELTQKIDELAARVSDMDKCIFNFHVPPYNSDLDLTPELDKNLKPVMEGGEMKMVPAGSVAVLKAIEKYQPLLALHGHIHEGRGATKIGKTLCINPGSDYDQGALRGAIIDIKPTGVQYTLTLG